MSTSAFSNYLIFVDESGDHGLQNIDPTYPLFILLFVLISKTDYMKAVCPSLQKFKFQFWGHDEVVLHEHEIRKPRGPFAFLLQSHRREEFYSVLNEMMSNMPVTLFAVVIDKKKLDKSPDRGQTLYRHAMQIGLERIYARLKMEEIEVKTTYVIVEKRGLAEDEELTRFFYDASEGANRTSRPMPFEVVLVPKTANSAGLQIADLMARPLGIHELRPNQLNRAYDIFADKIYKGPSGDAEQLGIERFP